MQLSAQDLALTEDRLRQIDIQYHEAVQEVAVKDDELAVKNRLLRQRDEEVAEKDAQLEATVQSLEVEAATNAHLRRRVNRRDMTIIQLHAANAILNRRNKGLSGALKKFECALSERQAMHELIRAMLNWSGASINEQSNRNRFGTFFHILNSNPRIRGRFYGFVRQHYQERDGNKMFWKAVKEVRQRGTEIAHNDAILRRRVHELRLPGQLHAMFTRFVQNQSQ